MRTEFMAAMQRVKLHVAEPPDSPELVAYVIHDYLEVARLRRDLSDATPGLDAHIEAFLRANEGLPVARGLKHDWLLSLADRRRWDLFLSHVGDTADAVIACDRLSARLATGDIERLGSEVLARWSLPQRQPSECNGPFAWLRTQGLITPEAAEARTRAALTADNPRLAHDAVGDVPSPRAEPLLQWLRLLDAPRPALAVLADQPETPVEPEALVSGFTRLAHADAGDAALLLPKLLKRPDVTPPLAVRLHRAAALGAAYSRDPAALAAFGALPEDANDTTVLEWRVRAALWAGDFTRALRWIDAMPPSLGSQPRWRFWHARSLEATGREGVAAAYGGVAGLRDFYGYLAADRLHKPYQLNLKAAPDDAAEQAALAAEPGLIRAHALFDCELLDDAAAEWSVAVGPAAPPLKVQAARLAFRWGWYAQTIATLAQAGEWDDLALRYPRPFAEQIAGAGRSSNVTEDWIFAVMRQESLFRRDAVSRADARGLMQMQPGTAAAVARRAHLPVPARDDLFDPQIAVPLGAAYLRELLDKYHGQLALSLAAYNAGPAAVARWLPAQPIDADIWIENVPYNETRGYVQHILEHIVAFAVMRGAEPARLSSLLPKVAPAALGE